MNLLCAWTCFPPFFFPFLSMCNHSALESLFRGVTDAQSIWIEPAVVYLFFLGASTRPSGGPLPLSLTDEVANRWSWKLNHMCWKAAVVLATMYLFLYIIYAMLISSSCFLLVSYFIVILFPFRERPWIKMKHWIKLMLSLTVCFIITYGLFLITLYYCLNISSYFDKPLKECLAELSLSLFCTTKKSLKSVLPELTYTPALFSSYWKHFKQSREVF